MELSEVVNPHFAFPVVGVVLCAFLVFAFGFKSPVQPPSFDFDSGDDGRKKKSKTKKKPHSNGQVSHGTEGGEVKSSAASKPNTGTKSLSTPKATAAVAEKSPRPPKEAKPKAKKVAVVKPTAAETAHVDSEENDGWETVGVNKKKKNKGKKEGEEHAPQIVADHKTEIVVEPPPAEVAKVALGLRNEQNAQVAMIDEIPQPPREKKERPGKAKNKDVASSKAVDLSDKENSPEVTSQDNAAKAPASKTSPKKASKSPVVAKPSPDHSAGTTQQQTTPKTKKAKTPDREGSQKSKTSISEETPSLPAKTADESQSSVTTAAKPQSQGTAAATSSSKDSKSPKKKKEKLKKESPGPSESNPSPAPVASSSSVQSEKQSISSHAQDVTTSSKSLLSSADTSSPTIVGASDVSQSADTAKESTTITFDEMGDWQEAKPVKKRKPKARRDN